MIMQDPAVIMQSITKIAVIMQSITTPVPRGDHAIITAR